jgi:N-acetylglucosamine kinase-like BadF-type ATPase
LRRDGLVLGVDGGGSKTLALAGDLHGQVLGRGVAGSSNFNFVGVEATAEALGKAMTAALANAHSEPQAVRAIVIGLAGAIEEADQAPIAAWAADRFPDAPTHVVHDTDLVLADGTPNGWGVAVISGTGAIVHGRNPKGETAYASGWGYLLGNEGSGYAIGHRALVAVVRGHDGRGPSTLLRDLVLAEWSLSRVEDLIRRVYGKGTSVADIAALAPLVEKAADSGDAVARAIAREAGIELALAVATVISRLRWPGLIPCAQAGGVLLHSRVVESEFWSRLNELHLPLHPITQVTEPAQGALRLAQRLLRGE